MSASGSAVYYAIELERGITKRIRLRFKQNKTTAFDLTGYTAKLQVREQARSSIVLLELSTENEGIMIDGVNGIVTLIFDHVKTAALSVAGETDLLLYAPDGEPMRVIYGPVTPVWTVTR